MRKTIHLIIFLTLVVSLSGCWSSPEPIEPVIITEYEYIYQPIPALQPKPAFQEYDIKMVKFKGQEFYVIPRVDGSILSSNWLAYKNWSETNYKILKEIKRGDSNESNTITNIK